MPTRIPRHAPLRALLALAAPFALVAGIDLTVTLAPPPIPVYIQPPCPDYGYLWTPGYWAWADGGYFWVPGTWVKAPEAGLLWTPGYWGWGGQSYVYHQGHWGDQVGFYGGINYGGGYGGSGFQGGYWQNQTYYYNQAVTRVDNSRITNVYNKQVTIINHSNVAYNGGPGGAKTAPSAQDRVAEQGHQLAPTAEQTQHHLAASRVKDLQAAVNHGKPPVAATARPADIPGAGPGKAQEPPPPPPGKTPKPAPGSDPGKQPPAPSAPPMKRVPPVGGCDLTG